MERIYSQTETDQIAREIVKNLSSGGAGAQLIALSGDLGAGKTTLAKSIARELGILDEITSPTFVIARIYDAVHPAYKKLVHMDAYRIEDLSELGPIGFDAYLADPETVLIVEWPEMIQERIDAHPGTHHYVLEHEGADTRRITRK